MWDIEVDVAVIGAGLGGLASAIAAADAGGEVMVVATGSDVPAGSAAPGGYADAETSLGGDAAPGALRERVGARQGWLIPGTMDSDTDEYLAAVADCVLDRPIDGGDGSVPRRDARNQSSDEAFTNPVETFFGSKLAGWAAQCIASPYGLMYTSMRDWRSTTMKSANGESVEALSIGTVEWVDGFGPGELHRWLTARARERDVEVEADSTLERIVFEDGVIVGVVLSTPEGPLAVRVRAGLTFAPSDQEWASAEGVGATGDRLHVCLVGRTGSRFSRVELLATEPTVPPRPTCTGSRRQVREGLHEARQQGLDGWRCGQLHGYPALGQ